MTWARRTGYDTGTATISDWQLADAMAAPRPASTAHCAMSKDAQTLGAIGRATAHGAVRRTTRLSRVTDSATMTAHRHTTAKTPAQRVLTGAPGIALPHAGAHHATRHKARNL